MKSQTNYDEQWLTLDDFIRYNPGARHRRRICKRILRSLRFSSLLDVGCGNGTLIREILDLSPAKISAIGVDVAASIVEKNKARVPDAGFRQLDIEVEALGERFDMIVCSEVVEHLNDRGRAFRNLATMLTAGGHLLVTCPTGHVYDTERHFGHVSHPTMDELVHLGGENNLSLVLSQNWGWPAYALLKFVGNLDSEWALKEFAGGGYSWPKRVVCHVLYLLNFLNVPDSKRGCQLFALFRKE